MNWNRSRFLAALVGVALGFVVALGLVAGGIIRLLPPQAPPAEPDFGPAPAIKVKPPPIQLPTPLPDLDRAAFLKAFAAAADAVASGQPLPKDNGKLVDRKFALRLPFGCSGQRKEEPVGTQAAAWAGWSFNPQTSALKLYVRPENFKDMPWVQDIAAQMPFEAVEGFWIRRPWSSLQSCPAMSGAGATVVGEERPTVAIAQFFAPDTARALRRGTRPYQVTTKLAQPPTADRGYGLIIEGRITAYPDGQPIHCKSQSADIRPVCLMAVEFSRVAFEDSAGELLSEWRS